MSTSRLSWVYGYFDQGSPLPPRVRRAGGGVARALGGALPGSRGGRARPGSRPPTAPQLVRGAVAPRPDAGGLPEDAGPGQQDPAQQERAHATGRPDRKRGSDRANELCLRSTGNVRDLDEEGP